MATRKDAVGDWSIEFIANTGYSKK